MPTTRKKGEKGSKSTGSRKASQDLRRRASILEIVVQASERFLARADWQTGIQQVMERLGHAVDACRVYLAENYQPPGGAVISTLRCIWCAPGYEREPEKSGAPTFCLEEAGMGRWVDLLGHNRVVKGTLHDLPPEERPALERLGVLSTLAVPVFVEGHWWGYIGLEDCTSPRRWSSDEEEALRLTAAVLGAAIARSNTQETIRNLFTLERKQRHLSQVMREVDAILGSSLDYETVLDRILEQIHRVVPYDEAHVLEVEEDGGIQVARARNREGSDPAQMRHLWNLGLKLEKTANLQWMAENHRPLVIPDVDAFPEWVHTPATKHIRSWAGAPILLKGRVVAFLSLISRERNFYTNEHAELLEAFTGQAGLALQNARLFAETYEALQREQRLNRISSIISGSTSMHTMLPTVVEQVVELVGGNAGSIKLINPDGSLKFPYTYNVPPALEKTATRAHGVGVTWEVIETRQPMLLADYCNHPKAMPEWVKGGLRTLVAAPLVAGSDCLGTLMVYGLKTKTHFTERDLELVQSVARQVAIALQNAGNLEAARRRAEEAETLRQAASAVSSSLELNEVFDHILEQLERVVPFDSAAIFLVEGDMLHMVDGKGFPLRAAQIGQAFPISKDVLFQEMIATGRPIILEDAMKDGRFNAWGGVQKVHGWAGTPLIVHGEVIGCLTLDSEKHAAYTPADADLIIAFAGEVALAIEKARLFKQVQRLAITDPLTGLHNRRYFFEIAQREVHRARRIENPLTLIMMDIDYFKKVNDTFGHQTGDRVLVELARRLTEHVRMVDVVARYGGEEFLVLLPDTDLEEAMPVAERLHQCLMEMVVKADKGEVRISVSLGLAQMDEGCTDIETLVQHADQALYDSKNQGRGRISVWKKLETI